MGVAPAENGTFGPEPFAGDGVEPVRLPPPPAARQSLWRHRNFRLFWSGQAVSMLGSAVSFVALPLVGVLLLDLDSFHMGVIASAATLPNVVLGPFVGPIVDRVDRLRLMIVTDAARALLIASIPVAAALGLLTFWLLVVVAAGVGPLTQLFNVANQAFLPRVVDPASLADGNGKLEASQSVADVTGPGLAGWLIALGGPATAVLVDAVSYAVSAGYLSRLRVRGDRPPPDAADHVAAGLWANIGSGFGLLWRDPVLRTVNVSYAVLALFSQMQMAVYMLFLVRTMHFSAGLIGAVFSLSGVVGFGTSLLCGRLNERIGVGRLLVTGQITLVVGGALLALIAGSRLQAATTMVLAEAFFAAGLSLYGVASRTLNQTRVADEVMGRVIGAGRVLTGIPVAMAGLLGGGIGTAFGPRASLVVGACGMFAALLLVLRRRVWTVGIGDVPDSHQRR